MSNGNIDSTECIPIVAQQEQEQQQEQQEQQQSRNRNDENPGVLPQSLPPSSLPQQSPPLQEDDIYAETAMNMSLYDPPRWGWTAVGGIADVLSPHEVRYLFFVFFYLYCICVLFCLSGVCFALLFSFRFSNTSISLVFSLLL